MGSSNTLTYDQTPPRRPGIDDLGGGAKENDTDPPDPVKAATAEDFNQLTKQIAALSKVLPLLIVTVRYSGGNPIIDSFACPSSSVTSGVNLNIARTGGGAGSGDVTISWDAGTFPDRNTSQPWGVALNDLLGTNRAPSAQTSGNGVRVVTTDPSAAAADIPFTVTIG